MLLILLGILINLASAPLIFLFGRAYQRRISPSIARRLSPLRRILPFEDGEPLVITYGYVLPRDKGNLLSVEQGDLVALLKAYQMVGTFCQHHKCQILDAFSLKATLNLHTNIFTLSGPKWNPVTEYYLGRFGSPAQFLANPTAISVKTRNMTSPEVFKTEREPGKLASVCYGLILSGSIQETDGIYHNVLMCAGRTTLSTNACLLYLNIVAGSSGSLKNLSPYGIAADKKWGVIIKVQNNRPQADVIEGPLHEQDVDISVVQVFSNEDFFEPYVFNYPPAQLPAPTV